MATPTLTPTPCNSGTEFRELGRTGIERNYTEFLGIAPNSQRFRIDLIPEFRTGIGSSLNGLSKHTAAGGLFVDFRTAFNQLWFNGLWIKLTKLNCPMTLISWLRHYLCNQKAFIDIKSSQSTVFNLAKGVPQGSVVGPVLFIIYHHDLLASLETIHWKHLFADDSSILFSPDSSLTPSNMIRDITEQIIKVLNRLIDYSKSWKQPINFNKTHWMLFNRHVASK
ncbi:unnamed protein product [Rotaria socialis]|uniref:Reverse transcriptase domain-containing protein n=1 Tax=Rotaria socialis TaxID=392032 RepID=A0A818N9S7_9BILA|nr:unnamed protein product [Rotaria socialis]